jgi:serine protease Do
MRTSPENDSTNPPVPARAARRLRAVALAGTALALVLSGAIAGSTFNLARPTPAYAEAVQVQGAGPASFADVIEKVRPAVVSVRVKMTTDAVATDDGNGGGQDMSPFFDFPPGSPMEKFFRQFRQQMPKQQQGMPTETALGSGFFISDDGYVVTNNHVVDKEKSVTVINDDGKEFTAKVIGTDPKTDLALLKVDAPGTKFTYVKFAQSEPRVGDWVVAVGNPFGLGGTVTAGIISARGRQIGASQYDDFLQIDAAVNKGNSGGPTFNPQGEVVGINTAIFSPSGGSVGIAFAIPASEAQPIISDLEQHGKVIRGWLGVGIQSVTQSLADSMKMPHDRGALVRDVQPGSPAEKAGFKSGDAITAVDGQQIKDDRDLSARIADMAPGKSVNVTYWRDGASHDTTVTLGTFPSDEQLAAANKKPDAQQPDKPTTTSLSDFGLTVQPSDDNTGVAVSDVDPNGQAAQAGLQPGDVILKVGNAEVNSPSAVEKEVAAAKASGLKAVRMMVKSGGQTQFVALSFAAS